MQSPIRTICNLEEANFEDFNRGSRNIGDKLNLKLPKAKFETFKKAVNFIEVYFLMDCQMN